MKAVPEAELNNGIDAVETPLWAPAESPLDMPQQVLEQPRRSFDLPRLLQAILPRQRV